MTPIFNCSPKLLIVFGPIIGIIAVAFGFIVLPYVYRWSNENQKVQNGPVKDFVACQSRKLEINEPEVYSINNIGPVAYSMTNIKPAIFISVGLFELLSRREIEAVLLHEMYHHKTKASFWKFSGNALRMFTPLAAFSCASEPTCKEENNADDYAVLVQKTNRHLMSAKRKIGNFNF